MDKTVTLGNIPDLKTMKKENKNECNSIFNPMYFIYNYILFIV